MEGEKICEWCGKPIDGTPAVVIDNQQANYYCHTPPDKSCYIEALDLQDDWLDRFIHSEID